MAAESDQPQEDLERSTEVVVTYGPEAVGRVRKVTQWVAGKATDGTAKAVEYTGKAIQFAGKGVQAAGTGISAVGTGISSTLGAIPFVGIPFRILGMGINGIGTGVQFFGKGVEGFGKGVESAGKGLGKVKQGVNNLGGVLKSGKNIAQLSKVAGGPVGWAMLALNSPLVKRIAKGIAALIAYLLLKFGLKLLGAIMGAAFGAITGLPLLAIPIAGPFLYAGWVGFWGYRGWNDPAAMLHLATHPWEIITKPLAQGWGWGKGAFNTVTGGPVEVGGGILNAGAGVVSTVGSAVTSVASAIWGGFTGAVGGAFGFMSSGLNFVVGGLTSVGLPASAAMIPVVGGVGTIAVAGTIVGITTATSFFSPQQDAVIGGTGDNEAFTIEKIAIPSRIPRNNDLPTEIRYTIKLTAKSTLGNIAISDDLQVNGVNGNFAISTINGKPLLENCSAPPPTELAGGESWSCGFEITAENKDGKNFDDSVVTNKVTVTATPTGQAPITEIAPLAITTIGSPPTDCPSGWPTDHGSITQGPAGPTSHNALLIKYGEQAIDIGLPLVGGDPAYATFNGKVTKAENDWVNGGYGRTVEIDATCGTTRFTARWSHLESIDPAIKVGSTVQFGQRIGAIDATGDPSYADHLHYALIGLDIVLYIPQEYAYPSCEDAACNVTWTTR